MAEQGGAPASVLRVGELVLRLDAGGTVVRAEHASGAPVWLDSAAEPAVTTARGTLELGPPLVSVDADEVEVERSGGGLRVLVRHSVEQAWTVRVVLSNESDADLALDEVRLGWRAAAGTVVTALAAGATAVHAVQPASGAGPLLVGRLRSGTQRGADEAGLLLGPLLLRPGHRWAVQWRWEVVPDARSAQPRGDLPRTTWLEQGQTVLLPAGPDVAVVAPGLSVEVEDVGDVEELDRDCVEVGAAAPGPARVELRSAGGTTAYDLTWAPDLDDLVDVEAAALLAGPTTPGGAVRLGDAASGLLLQDALGRRAMATPDTATEALELVAGLLAEQADDSDEPAGRDPLALALLAREADRSTGPAGLAMLHAATRGLCALTSPAPGLGLAGVAVALAWVRTQSTPSDVVAHLVTLLAASNPEEDAGLELAVLLGASGTDRGVGTDAVVAGLRRLGAALGAGLVGRVVPEVPLERVAHAATLLGLVDEATGQRLRCEWGITVSELARRTGAQARARVAEHPPGPDARRALAWLVLGRPAA